MTEAGDREKREIVELKAKKPWLFAPCWRCGKKAHAYDWLTDDGSTVESPTFESQAVLSLKVGDESYSGTFHIPLCFSCACLPHNSLPDGFRIL